MTPDTQPPAEEYRRLITAIVLKDLYAGANELKSQKTQPTAEDVRFVVDLRDLLWNYYCHQFPDRTINDLFSPFEE